MIENKELTVKKFLSLGYFFDLDRYYNCSGLFSMIHPKNFIREILYKRDVEDKDISLIAKQVPLVETKFREGIPTVNEVFVGIITDLDKYFLRIIDRREDIF